VGVDRVALTPAAEGSTRLSVSVTSSVDNVYALFRSPAGGITGALWVLIARPSLVQPGCSVLRLAVVIGPGREMSTDIATGTPLNKERNPPTLNGMAVDASGR
jgi:hypothetical protein